MGSDMGGGSWESCGRETLPSKLLLSLLCDFRDVLVSSSPGWTSLSWRTRRSLRAKVFEHMSHTKGFSLVWVRICRWRCSCNSKLMSVQSAIDLSGCRCDAELGEVVGDAVHGEENVPGGQRGVGSEGRVRSWICCRIASS